MDEFHLVECLHREHTICKQIMHVRVGIEYADKRVRHDEIVDLDHRFDYIADRYGRGDPNLLALIDKGRQRAFAAERELFALFPPHRSPDRLGGLVDPR